jgi:hypothetical protein
MGDETDVADRDDQDMAEMFDEEALGGDELAPVHHELLGPDLGGSDDVAELVASFDDAEGPIGPEDAAVHLEGER